MTAKFAPGTYAKLNSVNVWGGGSTELGSSMGTASLLRIRPTRRLTITADTMKNVRVKLPYEGQFLGGLRRMIVYGPRDIYYTIKARYFTKLYGERPGPVHVRNIISISGKDAFDTHVSIPGMWQIAKTSGRENIYFIKGAEKVRLIWEEECFHSIQYKWARYGIEPYRTWFRGCLTIPREAFSSTYKKLMENDARNFIYRRDKYSHYK